MTGGTEPGGASTGRLGMRFLVASLSMLFGATLMGYVVVRSRAAAWPPPGVPSLPAGLLPAVRSGSVGYVVSMKSPSPSVPGSVKEAPAAPPDEATPAPPALARPPVPGRPPPPELPPV